MSGGLATRFWSKVNRGAHEECWPWTRALGTKGYGAFGQINASGQRRMVSAHRVAWELTHGPIPAGLMVCHRCDNRVCCNPAHLFLGTAQDNVDDMVAKGRQGVWTAGMRERLSAVKRGKRMPPGSLARAWETRRARAPQELRS